MPRTMAALVMGNAAYPKGHSLANPVNDATDLGAKLKSYGFNVIVAADNTAKEMEKQLKEFRSCLRPTRSAYSSSRATDFKLKGATTC